MRLALIAILALLSQGAMADANRDLEYSYCAGKTADGSCKASAGFVHTVTCASNDAAATAGDVAIRDATAAGAGTVVQDINFAAAFFPPVTVILDANFTTGIFLDFTTTADVMCSVSYR